MSFLAAVTDIAAHRGKHEEISRTGELPRTLNEPFLKSHRVSRNWLCKRLSRVLPSRLPVSSSFSPLKSAEINCLCFREPPTARARGDFLAHGASISAVLCSNPPSLSRRASLTRQSGKEKSVHLLLTSAFRLDKRKIFLS